MNRFKINRITEGKTNFINKTNNPKHLFYSENILPSKNASNYISQNCNLGNKKFPIDEGQTYLNINCKCSNIKGEGIISKNDKDYDKYIESDLYKNSGEGQKNLNAYLWYYATNKLHPNSMVKTNIYGAENFKMFNKKWKWLVNELNSLSCKILSKKSMFIDITKENKEVGLLFKVCKVISIVYVFMASISFIFTSHCLLDFTNICSGLGLKEKVILMLVILVSIIVTIYFLVEFRKSKGIKKEQKYIIITPNKNSTIENFSNDYYEDKPNLNEDLYQDVHTDTICPETKKKIPTFPGGDIPSGDPSAPTRPDCRYQQFGCCPNSDVPKIDKEGTNCNVNNEGYNNIALLIVIGILLFTAIVLICVFGGLVSKIIYILFIIFSLLFIANGLNLFQNVSGISIERANNTYITMGRKKIDTSKFKILFIFLIIFIIQIPFRLQYAKSNSIILLILFGLLLFPSMLFISILILGSFFIASNNPVKFLIVVFALRVVWSIIFNILSSIKNLRKSLLANILAVSYDYPLEYFAKLFNNTSIQNLLDPSYKLSVSKLTNPSYMYLPTGMPWDLPGVKLFKIILLLIAQKFNSSSYGCLIPKVENLPARVIGNPASNVTYFSSLIPIFNPLTFVYSVYKRNFF